MNLLICIKEKNPFLINLMTLIYILELINTDLIIMERVEENLEEIQFLNPKTYKILLIEGTIIFIIIFLFYYKVVNQLYLRNRKLAKHPILKKENQLICLKFFKN